ncbi:MAG TPA: glycine oxidase ThiO [Pyrinomonadaceae bacterium]|nr:glycine oxidase ThiO [Pyrinomonadaceae bacterium]
MGNQEAKAAEAIVIGGGVVGLCVARSLALKKMKVVLLERGASPGMETSSAAGGMLAPQCEADAGGDFFDLASAGRDLYPSFADALLEETGVDVELDRTGTLYLAFTEEDEAEINSRYEWQRRAALSVEKLSAREAREMESWISPQVKGALLFPKDVQVENRKLVAALTESILRLGVQVRTKTEALRLIVDDESIRGVETSDGVIQSSVIVLACGAWSSSIIPSGSRFAGVRIEPVRGQMLCFALPDQRPMRHVIYSPRGYVVPRQDGRLLAGSTTEHVGFEAHVTADGLRKISTAAMEIAPQVGQLALTDFWAGLRPRAEDDMPVLGACPETSGLFYATGHYRNGILLAPITGELIAEQIVNRRTHALLNRFSPARFTPVGAI